MSQCYFSRLPFYKFVVLSYFLLDFDFFACISSFTFWRYWQAEAGPLNEVDRTVGGDFKKIETWKA